MPKPLSINLKNNLSTLPEGLREVISYLKDEKVAPHDINRTELVLEELLSNTIKYGYRDNQEHLIHLHITVWPQKLDITIRDDASPFDPRTETNTNTNAPLETRKIGGLGLLLVNKFTDDIDYHATPTSNHYTLTLLRND